MKHRSPISLSPDVERRIKDPEVLRVLRLFISLGQTDIIEFLNGTIHKNPQEVRKTLDTVYYYVKRGLQTQKYLTEQMRTAADPSDWPYSSEVDKPFTPDEKQLIEKFGTRWPTVRGALDMFRNNFEHCVEKRKWKGSTGLTYRAWSTVNVCPNKLLWDGNSSAYENERFLAYLQPKFIIFYPGLVNLAFLEQNQVDELEGDEERFGEQWTGLQFRKRIAAVTSETIEECSSIDDIYINLDRLWTGGKLAQKRRLMRTEFVRQSDRLVKANATDFGKFSYARGWQKFENFWQPADMAGSILHLTKMMVGYKPRTDGNLIYNSESLSAVRMYGIVPATTHTSSPESLSNSVSKYAEKNRERGKLHDMSRKERTEVKERPPTQNSRDRGSSKTRTGSHGQQQHRESDKRAESKPPAKKLESSDKVKTHPPGHSQTRAKPHPRESVSRAEAKPPAKQSSSGSRKPAAQSVPSLSRTGGSTSRR
ncbi:uncharacterized protein Bfra_011684 [Botrytis fragariae]|uniref:Uncharacterized protein n=1 Tax=Botrytis fragariae TaxID=1964551 RepID=A0A8H6AK65_9HELO|nr:uncharacterized protein Bfra_011684 [Botrytis fragariae]KAF5869141.1 hypothetical protein Bfra_011684 [Botrytis fragariae]